MTDANTKQAVECPICGEEFDPTVAGGWCTNTECGEWQYTGGDDAEAEAASEPDDGFVSPVETDDEDEEPVDLFSDAAGEADGDAADTDAAAAEDDVADAAYGAVDDSVEGDASEVADDAYGAVDDSVEDDASEVADDAYGAVDDSVEDDAATDEGETADAGVEDADEGDVATESGVDESAAEASETAEPGVGEADEAETGASGVDDAADEAAAADDPEAEDAEAVADESGVDEAEAATIDCPDCGAQLDADANFCVECGTDVSAVTPGVAELDACPGCGTDVEPEDNFCVNCGEDLAAHRDGAAEEHEDAIDALEASDDDEVPESLVLEVEGREIPVEDGDTVGREIRAALTDAGRPDDEAVRIHREHVRFVRESDSFYLLDLGDNPTQLNGQTLQKGDREPVGPGDELELSGVAAVSVLAP